MNNNFLQSNEWRKFQEAFGRKTFHVSSDNFSASIIEHKLPIVGSYFYIPRGPIIKNKGIDELIDLAKKEKAGWIRFDPENEKVLKIIKSSTDLKIVKAPHDVQPKQIFVIDIAGSEEEILAKMKSKTRYNIRLAEKKGLEIKTGQEYLEDFLRLTKIMAKRQGITPHPDEYYRKMLEIIPEEMARLYVAEYDGPASTRGSDRSSTRGGKIIAANIMVFFSDTAIYLHGASDDNYKNLMAPHLLQWRGIQEAKKRGCIKYDFGGVKASTSPQPSPQAGEGVNAWAGITRFKLGFAPDTKPMEFLGSYDIIVSPARYWLYRFIQRFKNLLG
jgi:lipid II:glycine glycyltransferase (peptidoglycan interpeptide bridge formation enzyme)